MTNRYEIIAVLALAAFLTGSGLFAQQPDIPAMMDSLASSAVFWGDQDTHTRLTETLAAQPAEEFFQYLESPWALYISAAIEVLKKQGAPTVEAVARNLEAETGPRKQAICLAVLYEIGSENNLDAVLPFLESGEVSCTAVHALRCLAKWGKADKRTVDILTGYLGSDDCSTVLAALHALESILERHGGVEAVENLRPALENLQSHSLKQVSLTAEKILNEHFNDK